MHANGILADQWTHDDHEITELTKEIMLEEGCNVGEAAQIAIDQYDSLITYALLWDFDVAIAGNTDAIG